MYTKNIANKKTIYITKKRAKRAMFISYYNNFLAKIIFSVVKKKQFQKIYKRTLH